MIEIIEITLGWVDDRMGTRKPLVQVIYLDGCIGYTDVFTL